uniref:Uncharacterized protein n=1 Tax=mine drainage metagenome TaxID=410659 RepID=E6QK61_9ZZZZ
MCCAWLGLSPCGGNWNSELVADGADGLDAVAEASGVVEFSAQTADVHVEAAVEGIELSVEDDLGEGFAGEDLSGGEHKRAEEFELDVCEVESYTAAERGASAGIEFDVSDGEMPDAGVGRGSVFAGNSTGGSGAAAKDGADAGEQFARVEWLGKIVVGTDFKANNAVDVFAAGGEQEDADLRACAQASQHLEAIEAGKHDIQQDDSEVAAECAVKAEFSVMLGGDGEAMTRKIVLDHGSKLGVVVDEEYGFQGEPRRE